MKCKHCNEEIQNIKGIYMHKKTNESQCEKKVVAEPTVKEVGTFVCKDWSNCIYGAGCTLSSFNSETPKTDPTVIFDNGIFYCKRWTKG